MEQQACFAIGQNAAGEAVVGVAGCKSPKRISFDLDRLINCAEFPGYPVTVRFALENLYSAESPVCQGCKSLPGRNCREGITDKPQ